MASGLPVLIAVKLEVQEDHQYVCVNDLEPFAHLCGKKLGSDHPARIVRAFAVAFSNGRLRIKPKLFCSKLVTK